MRFAELIAGQGPADVFSQVGSLWGEVTAARQAAWAHMCDPFAFAAMRKVAYRNFGLEVCFLLGTSRPVRVAVFHACCCHVHWQCIYARLHIRVASPPPSHTDTQTTVSGLEVLGAASISGRVVGSVCVPWVSGVVLKPIALLASFAVLPANEAPHCIYPCNTGNGSP